MLLLDYLLLPADLPSRRKAFVKTHFGFILFTFLAFFSSCQNKTHFMKLEGRAQGTTYRILYFCEDSLSYKEQADSLLRQLDQSLSTYNPGSIISRINRNDSTVMVDHHFIQVFNKSMEVAERTDGSFDITVAPIVNAYGFGFTEKQNINSAVIDSLLRLVDYKMVQLKGMKLTKANPRIMLDFNAIAQGYSVDVLASYLENKGIEDYLVELGGEVKAKGTKENDEPWRVGIDRPEESIATEGTLQGVVKLKNKAMATSGNYKRYYEENGQKYAHIIDPSTGYPAKHNMLSASVITTDCMTADAYATAFMVMGVEKSKSFLAKNRDLGIDVFFIYEDDAGLKTYMSEGLRTLIQEIP